MRAALCASTIAVRSVATPFVLGSTRNSVSPSRSPAAPALRAATIRRSAVWPSTTKALSPESLKPLPERTACSLVMQRAMFWRLRRSPARPAASHRDIFGRYCDFCASLPPRDSADAASTRCRQIRRRHQGAADLLHHDAGLDAAEPAAAERFRHQQAGKSHLGKGLPQLAGKPVASLASRSCRRCDTGALSLIKPARAVAQHRLFFVEDECHEVDFRCSD